MSNPTQAVPAIPDSIECQCGCCDDCEERIKKTMNTIQNGKYARQGDVWVFVGETADTLPPAIYKTDRGSFGPRLKEIDLKTDAPIDLPGSTSEKITDEVSAFWQLEDKFKNVGVLHKRGLLLYGPPGAGKTSTVCAVARKIVREKGLVFVLVNGDFQTMKNAVLEVRRREPNRPIVNIIEDIDELIDNGSEEELLSFLDGEDQINHVVNVGTTNNLEKMGPRLINRPCRFDVVIEVGMPSQPERLHYLKAKVGDTKEALDWANNTDGMSLAHLRELVVGVKCMGETPERVIKRLRAMMGKKLLTSPN